MSQPHQITFYLSPVSLKEKAATQSAAPLHRATALSLKKQILSVLQETFEENLSFKGHLKETPEQKALFTFTVVVEKQPSTALWEKIQHGLAGHGAACLVFDLTNLENNPASHTALWSLGKDGPRRIDQHEMKGLLATLTSLYPAAPPPIDFPSESGKSLSSLVNASLAAYAPFARLVSILGLAGPTDALSPEKKGPSTQTQPFKKRRM